MPEEHEDQQILAALAHYRADVMGNVPPQDIAGVRGRARRRARNHVTAAAAITALALVIPAAAYAMTNDRHGNGPANPTPTVTGTDSSGPAPSTSASGSGTAAGAPTPGAPNGQLTIDELLPYKYDLESWHGEPGGAVANCPTKQVTLHYNSVDLGLVNISKVVHGDVDHDGAPETVAILSCQFGQASRQQVVYFDRDDDGYVELRSQVVSGSDAKGGIQRIYDVEIDAPTGGIGVQVGDRFACCSQSDEQSEHQQRWYTWDGQRFAQTDGPTAFTPRPIDDFDLTVSAEPVQFGAASGGVRTGKLAITVKNGSAVNAPGVQFKLLSPDVGGRLPVGSVTFTASSGASADCPAAQDGNLLCHFPALASGATRTYTFTVTAPAAADAVLNDGSLESIQFRVTAEQRGVRIYSNQYHQADVTVTK